MLSHEPKNYALLGYDGSSVLRGVAFRSSRAEPFGETFLRRAIARLLVGDVSGVREAYVAMADALRRRELPALDVSSRVRLTKSPAEYRESREARRELAYEAMLASGRTQWRVGDRVRVYRTRSGLGAVIDEDDGAGARDYDANHYVRMLRETFAARLARAFSETDFEAVFADPEQMSLFTPAMDTVRPRLNRLTS
jgi:DNA polymerase elongation subunit (family B)